MNDPMTFTTSLPPGPTDRQLLAQALEIIMSTSKDRRAAANSIPTDILGISGDTASVLYTKLAQAEATIRNIDKMLAEKAKTCDELSDIMAVQLKQLKECEEKILNFDSTTYKLTMRIQELADERDSAVQKRDIFHNRVVELTDQVISREKRIAELEKDVDTLVTEKDKRHGH